VLSGYAAAPDIHLVRRGPLRTEGIDHTVLAGTKSFEFRDKDLQRVQLALALLSVAVHWTRDCDTEVANNCDGNAAWLRAAGAMAVELANEPKMAQVALKSHVKSRQQSPSAAPWS
jgi:hypothetical protein